MGIEPLFLLVGVSDFYTIYLFSNDLDTLDIFLIVCIIIGVTAEFWISAWNPSRPSLPFLFLFSGYLGDLGLI